MINVTVKFKDDFIYQYHEKDPKVNIFQVYSSSCEKITTQLTCPSCKGEGLIDYIENYPGVDLICTLCDHKIEVKSIVALGSQSMGYVPNQPVVIKLGSPTTYAKVQIPNKSLIVYWYRIRDDVTEDDENKVEIIIQDCIIIPMNELTDQMCQQEIVFQKKKRTPKIQLTIFPELSDKIKVICSCDFIFPNANTTKRNELMNEINEFIKFVQSIRQTNKKIKRKAEWIEYRARKKRKKTIN